MAEQVIAACMTGIVAFVSTNIDDIVLLMHWFSQTGGAFRRHHVVAGQYLGFGVLLVASLLGYLGALVVPREWLGLLGFAPIALGIRRLLALRHADGEPAQEQRPPEVTPPGGLAGLLGPQAGGVAAVTVANGGDNIAIYVPLLATQRPVAVAIILAVFLLLVGVWCSVGYVLTRHPAVAWGLSRYGHRLVPWVLIGLGCYILIESDTLRWLLSPPT